MASKQYNCSIYTEGKDTNAKLPTDDEKQLILFCRTPRTRAEILDYLRIHSWQYALKRYVEPLLRNATLRMTIPESPRSRNQKFVSVENEGHRPAGGISDS